MSSEILLVSSTDDFIQRAKDIPYKSDQMESLDLIDLDKKYAHKITLVDGRGLAPMVLSGSGQIATQLIPESKVIIVVDNKISQDQIRFMYKSGVDLILSEDDYFQTQKMDFYIQHYLRNSYVPVKTYDFIADTTPDFVVYHFLSFKGTFVPVIYETITPHKIEKLKLVNEVYIKRADLGKYKKYLDSIPQNSENILSQCRAQYLEFCENYVDLLYKVTDNSKNYTFNEGRDLLSSIASLSQSFLKTLTKVEDPWLVVNNLLQESHPSPLKLVPAVAAYTGISALELGMDKPEDIMLAVILSDVGLLAIPPRSTFPYEGFALERYKNHPNNGLNLVLERKIPLDDRIKQIIQYSHENLKRTGFPRGADINPERIPLESQLLQICHMANERLLIRAGSVRPNIKNEKRELINQLLDSQEFSIVLLHQLKNSWDRAS